ncbi:hypothetical protein Ares1_0039 [Vibrio phage Ares1]|nr:hypothetical protein Ares1_0039 [Vibrio phage Ares1]
MAVKITKKKSTKPTLSTAKPSPQLRTQVTHESTDMDGERVERILRDESETTAIPDKEYTQPVANVGFNCSMTKNLGDFNSLKVGVSLHLPCYVHEIGETYDHAKKFVEDKLNEVMDEYADVTASDLDQD